MTPIPSPIKTQMLAPGLELRFHRETEMVSTMRGTRKPDPSWRHLDKQDHVHAWIDGKLPTLNTEVVGKTWVGDERDGEEIDLLEHRCRICNESIEPKYVTDYTPVMVAGPPEYTLVVRAGIRDQEFRIPPDDVTALIGILQRMFGP